MVDFNNMMGDNSLNEVVEFVTLDGRPMKMTRGAAELAKSKGMGDFTVPLPEPDVSQFMQPDAAAVPAHEEPTVQIGGGEAPLNEIDSVVNPQPLSPQLPGEPVAEEIIESSEPIMVQEDRERERVEEEEVQLRASAGQAPTPARREVTPTEEVEEDLGDLDGEDAMAILEQKEAEVARTKAAALEAEGAGLTSAAALLHKAAAEQDRALDKQRNRLTAQREKAVEDEARVKADVDRLTDEIKNTDIGDSRGLGKKMLGALAMGMFQFGSTIAGTGGPNLAMQIIQDSISRDINEQRRKLSAKHGLRADGKNELARLRGIIGDTDAAEAKLEAARYAQAANKAKAFAMQAKGNKNFHQAQQLQQELEAKAAERDVHAEQLAAQARVKMAEQKRKEEFEIRKIREQQVPKAERLALDREKFDFDKKKFRQEMNLKRNTMMKAGMKKADADRRVVAELYRKEGIQETTDVVNKIKDLYLKKGVSPQDLGTKMFDFSFLKSTLSADEAEARQLLTEVVQTAANAQVGPVSDKDIPRYKAMSGAEFWDTTRGFMRAMQRLEEKNNVKRDLIRAQTSPEAVDFVESSLRRSRAGRDTGLRDESF